MPAQSIQVTNEAGLHARPAAEFVKEANRHAATIQVRNLTTGSAWADAKSILSVLTLGVERGHEIEICTQGEGEDEALEALLRLLRTNFEGRL